MRSRIYLRPLLLGLGACSSAPAPVAATSTASEARAPATASETVDRLLKDFGVGVYFANLHSHHFMGEGSPASARCEAPGPFPYDDGRPCVNGPSGDLQKVSLPRFIDYFTEACEYARTKGDLDILYVTPHTKSGSGGETDTPARELAQRQQILVDLNAKYDGHFFCGLGQEASAIGEGNHLGMIGHLPNSKTPTRPVYFPPGRFEQAYGEIGERSRRGEKFILQFNHPDVHADISWGAFKPVAIEGQKDDFNDYGLDDFAPLGCLVAKSGPRPANCAGVQAPKLTTELLQQTYAEMRKVADDRFRLIETVHTGGATTNGGEVFKKVQERRPEGGKKTIEPELYDYLFYLNMGFHLAPTGNQDNHSMNWGSASATRTGVLAKSLSERDVLDALDQRHTFASEDKNARLVFFAKSSTGRALMGDIRDARDDTIWLYVAYDDPDGEDSAAGIRIFRYRSGEDLKLSGGAPSIRRLLDLRTNPATLPSGPPTDPGFNLVTSTSDPEVRTGNLRGFRVPLEPGEQYFVVELTQRRDLDKLWSAPIWIKR